MRTALVLALCVTGCFSDRGAAIEIDVGDTGAATVELFTGQACSSGGPCKVIALPDAACTLRGSLWYRDAPARFVATVSGRRATFRLTADAATTLPIVIAVGFDAGSVPVGTAKLSAVDIPVDSARIDSATLTRATALDPARPPAAGTSADLVKVWTTGDMPPSSCVVVEHWRPGMATSSEAIGPADDPDCSADATAATGRCTTDSSNGVCLLGSRACNADGTVGTSCAPAQRGVCVPDQLCGKTSDDQITTALKQIETPRISCTITVGVLDGHVCDTQPRQIDVGQALPHGCPRARLSTLPLGVFAQSATFNGVMLELSSSNGQCNAVKASGTASLPAPLPGFGAIRFEGKASALLLPFQITFQTDTCSPGVPQTRCMLEVGDSAASPLWMCAQ